LALNEAFKIFVLVQRQGIGEFETKRMFGVLELYHQGAAFAKIKNDKVWLKVDDTSYSKFERDGMSQYTNGKDNSRKLNVHKTPIEIIEDIDKLKDWVQKSIEFVQKK
jgi:TfoX/Sxy family transcriptional regulator of competence genes